MPGPSTQAWSGLDAESRALARDLFARLLEAREDGNMASVAVARERLADAPREIRDVVAGLLAAHARAAGLFDEPAAVPEATPLHPDQDSNGRIGPYTLGAELGRGGFGIVYRATQTSPVQREVAIKVLRGDLITPEVLARFRAETRALARMDDPGLARVLDAGIADDGRPYVVMELVEGGPITEYCEGAQLAVRDRVALFAGVCRAVHHAHQRAVVHRDLKPANVLVGIVDGRPRARVIDFGIAKLLGESRDDMVTRAGVILGTPRYMSPEQAGGHDSVDVRTDVFALGILLGEVLTGSVPDLGMGSGAPAPRPGGAAAAPTAPAGRTRRLRGDLDRVVRKATKCDPEERYESAGAMADDLERYLAGEPVRAAPATRLYLAGKFMFRHRVLVGLSTAASIAILISLGVAVAGWVSAVDQRNQALTSRARAQAVTHFLLVELLDAMDPDSGAAEPSLGPLLKRTSAEAELWLGHDPALLVEVLERLGRAQRARTYFEDAAETFRRAADRAAAAFGPDDDRTLNLLLDACAAALDSPRPAEQGSTAESVLDTISASRSPADPVLRRVRVLVAAERGGPDAIADMQRALREMQQAGLAEGEHYQEAMLFTGRAMIEAADPGAADLLRAAAETAELPESRDSSRLLQLRITFARALLRAGNASEAEAVAGPLPGIIEQMFGAINWLDNEALLVLARAEAAQGDFAAAAQHYERQLASTIALLDEHATQAGVTYRELAECRIAMGEYAAASELLERAFAVAESNAGPDDPVTLTVLARLAGTRLMLGEWQRAQAEAERVLSRLPADRPAFPDAAAALATALSMLGENQQASATLKSAIDAMRGAGARPEDVLRLERQLAESGTVPG